MTAVDHAARIAEELDKHADFGAEVRVSEWWYFCDCGESVRMLDLSGEDGTTRVYEWHLQHRAEALHTAGIGVLPEAEVTEEWLSPDAASLKRGIDAGDPEAVAEMHRLMDEDPIPAPEVAEVVEEHGCAMQDGKVLGPIDEWSGYRRNELRATHRRTRTRYADQVTEWEAIDV